MRYRQRHRGQAFGRRIDDHHGVAFPWLPRDLVPDAAPQVDDLLAAHIGADPTTELSSMAEVLNEHIAHGLETAGHGAFNDVNCGHDVPPTPRAADRASCRSA